MITFAGIDGTSSLNDAAYQIDFYNSFVNKLGRNEIVHFTNPWYLRGPFTSGFDTRKRAKAALEHVTAQWKSGAAKAIFLAGYSRGAAAVIEVASMLKKEDIPVECLILFDPVDRTNTLGPGGDFGGGIFFNTVIPDTVRMVIRPERNILTTLSRVSFQKCGQKLESSRTELFTQLFYATHGGLGGTPWEKAVLPSPPYPPNTTDPIGTIWEFGEINRTTVTPAEDRQGSAQVWNTVKPIIVGAYERCVRENEKRSYVPPTRSYPGFPPSKEPPNSTKPTYPQRIHVVKSGDWLSKIAITYYGDMNKWKMIYEHPENRRTIGPNPDLIKPGQRLIIP